MKDRLYAYTLGQWILANLDLHQDTCAYCQQQPGTCEIYRTDGHGTVLEIVKVCRDCNYVTFRNGVFNRLVR